MKKRLSGLLILTMTVYLLFSGGFIFSVNFPVCAFGAEHKKDTEIKSTTSVASSSSAVSVVSKSSKRKVFPRFRLILESEEIFCGQKVQAKLSGLLETDELTFRIKKSDSSIEEEGEVLKFDRMSDNEHIVIDTSELEAGIWQLMAMITRKNISTSLTCDFVTVDKGFDVEEDNHSLSETKQRSSSVLHVSSLTVLKISAPYIGEGVWVKDGKNWKLLTESGVFAQNQWAFLGGRWYVFDSNGNMLVGWQNINQNWYFMNKDGTMATGWILDNHKWYFLAQSGEMYASAVTPDGYLVNSSGEWVVNGIVQTGQ